jgi:hypothetical protein
MGMGRRRMGIERESGGWVMGGGGRGGGGGRVDGLVMLHGVVSLRSRVGTGDEGNLLVQRVIMIIVIESKLDLVNLIINALNTYMRWFGLEIYGKVPLKCMHE